MNNEKGVNVRPIHYLGSKLRMLDSVKTAVDMVDESGGCLCDLFSGSGTVSKYFAEYRDVISVDIQNYSSVLCEATMKYLQQEHDIHTIMDEIMHSEIRTKQIRIFNTLLEYEEQCITDAQDGNINNLYEIIEKGSIYIYLKEKGFDYSARLNMTLEDLEKKLINEEEINSKDNIITRYYGGLYFSYKQSVDMDSIESYVFEKSGLLKTKLLAALLSTASEIVNTVGKQFAQPLKVTDSKGKYKVSLAKKIMEDRSLNVFEIYEKWLQYYMAVGEDKHEYISLCDDYLGALDKLKQKNVSVIYADPPYTRYHYSRYYHVLETICLRDNPEITTTFPNGTGGISRAIYRAGRHQSPFCIKSQAEKAFDELFKKVKELNIPLVLSYSPFDASKAVTPRLQSIEQLVDKAKLYFEDVVTMSPGEFTHSKLNSTDKNFEANHEAEILILCKN